MCKVIVCGGRDNDNYDGIIRALDAFNKKHPITLLIEGGAKGADAHAAVWADNNKIDRVTAFCNWAEFGNRAGPIRNKMMATKLGADYCIAFKGGSGTKNMISQAKANSIPVWEVMV